MPKKLKVSIIIVHYKAKRELFECLQSIKISKPKVSYEVIVIDNDEKKTTDKELKKKFPWVEYIKSPGNIGFGAGSNLGSEQARGEYLFFLNPDTVVLPGVIDKLVIFMEKEKEVGIVAPMLLNDKGKLYPLQGTGELSPLAGIFALSFINKYFPGNPISYRYWLLDWDKTTTREVNVVPGSAFIIRRKVFDKVNGFDENFFLYFEESDLCKRVKEAGWKIVLTPQAKVIHLWKRSTPKKREILRIFKNSRFYYFKKHYGFLKAVLVEIILRSGKWLARLF